jgi:hypothetical protein
VRRAADVVAFCRRFAKDALVTAVALDIVAPVPGRTWVAICCSCLEREEHDIADELVHRLAFASWMSFPGGCLRCTYYGCDTLVAAVRRSAEAVLDVAA